MEKRETAQTWARAVPILATALALALTAVPVAARERTAAEALTQEEREIAAATQEEEAVERDRNNSQSYGLGSQVYVVSSLDFVPSAAGMTPLAFSVSLRGSNPGSASPQAYYAPFSLPAGAKFVSIRCRVTDSSAVNNVNVQLKRSTEGGVNTPADISSSGSSGDQEISQDFNHLPVEYEGGGNLFYLRATIASDTSLRSCAITWQRQIRTASLLDPPSFNDVPASNGAYDAIEALKASGITAGSSCPESGFAPPTFCPSQTVTRGQMALFLARALGLHWPD